MSQQDRFVGMGHPTLTPASSIRLWRRSDFPTGSSTEQHCEHGDHHRNNVDNRPILPTPPSSPTSNAFALTEQLLPDRTAHPIGAQRAPSAAAFERTCSGVGSEACRFSSSEFGRRSMAWKANRRQFGHRPIVYFFHDQPARRMPYFPHGSVNPHLVHRTCQPGALFSGSIPSVRAIFDQATSVRQNV